MNKTQREWIAKAEGDFASAGRELRARKRPNFDAACFHSQQCIEKLMKALLIHGAVSFPKTHDLVVLHQLFSAPISSASKDELRLLTGAAVALRYPGETANRADAAKAYRICVCLRKELLSRLRSRPARIPECAQPRGFRTSVTRARQSR